MQLSVAALLAASVAAAGTGCAVHQECGHCLDATDDDNDSCFCAPHRALELMGPPQLLPPHLSPRSVRRSQGATRPVRARRSTLR